MRRAWPRGSGAFDAGLLIFSQKQTTEGVNAYLAVQRVCGPAVLTCGLPPLVLWLLCDCAAVAADLCCDSVAACCAFAL